MGYNEFKSKFLGDMSQYRNAKSKINRFKSALDRAVNDELPARDAKRLFLIRDFTNTNGLRISHSSPSLMCTFSEEEEHLKVGVVGPAWKRGWKHISKDPFVSDLVDDFFHLANQYIYRAYQINLIGAIALTYGRPCDFRGVTLSEMELPSCEVEFFRFRDSISWMRSNRNDRLKTYLNVINALDPFVNKALYYYARSLSLLADEYDEEAITAADNAVDSISQAVKQRKRLPTTCRENLHQIVGEEIGLSQRTIRKINNLYQLRCHFSAHPAQSKWWDFFEIYSDNVSELMDEVRTTVIKFLLYEKTHSEIEPTPKAWSDWFLEHCDIVYDAVWFHRLPWLLM